MRKIKIFDTTLRDGEQSPGCSMDIHEKIMIAKELDKMQVDIIEAGFAASSKRDFEAIKEISKVVSYAKVASLARCDKKDIDLAYEAVKDAKHPRLHIFIATSELHMKYKLEKTEEEVKEIVEEMVKYAKSKCEDIEFSLEDATRTNLDFAVEIIDIAIKNGATTINIPDTVGYTTPEEFIRAITYIKKHSKKINKVDISVHCHNDLGLATANSLLAVKCGINQIECTINGIGERAGNTALEEVVAALDTRGDYFEATTSIDTTKIYQISQMVSCITGSFVQNNKPIVGRNAFLHEAGIHQAGVLKNKGTYEIMDPKKYGVYVDSIVLGIHSGRNAIINKIEKLGYNSDHFNIDQIVDEVKEIFSREKYISENKWREIITTNKINVKRKS